MADKAKVLQYRPAARQLYSLALVATILAEIIIIRVKILEVANEDIWWFGWKLLLASTVTLSIMARLWFFLRPRLFSKYILYPDSLVILFKKKEQRIDFDQIEKVRISLLSPRFLGGFSLLTKSGQRINFFSALKGSHRILQQVVEVKPDLIGTTQLQSYIDASQLVDISWKRIKEKLLNWKSVSLKYILFPLVLSGFSLIWNFKIQHPTGYFSQFIYNSVLFGCCTLIVGMACNSIEEHFINAELKPRLNTSPAIERNHSHEKKVSRIINLFYLTLCLSLFSALMFSIGQTA